MSSQSSNSYHEADTGTKKLPYTVASATMEARVVLGGVRLNIKGWSGGNQGTLLEEVIF